MRLDRGENLDEKTRPHFLIYLNIRADKAQGLYSTLCMQLEVAEITFIYLERGKFSFCFFLFDLSLSSLTREQSFD